MGIVIKSTDSTTEAIVDQASQALRVSLYDVNGDILTGTEDSYIAISMSALSATTTLDMAGHNGVGFTITNMGHASNVITCEYATDGSWVAVPAINTLTNNSTVNVTEAGTYTMRFGEGVSQVRLRVSSYTSGTVTGSMNASYANAGNVVIRSFANVYSVKNTSTVQLAAGATFTGVFEADLFWQGAICSVFADQDLTVVFEQSNDGVTAHESETWYYKANSTALPSRPYNLSNNYHRVKVTNTGAAPTTTLFINTYALPNFAAEPASLTAHGNKAVEIPEKATYRATFSGALIATAVLTVKGSATKLVTITKMGWSESGSASTMKDVTVKKYSSIATGGGAATTVTGVPLSSRYAAATAVCQAWTVAAGTQTSIGTLECFRYRPNVAADNFATGEKQFIFDNGQRGASGIDLISASEWAGIDNSAAVANSLGCVWVEWTEE